MQYELIAERGCMPELVRMDNGTKQTIVRGTIETVCKFLWCLACKHEGIEYRNKFVVLSPDNPIRSIYDQAMCCFLKQERRRKASTMKDFTFQNVTIVIEEENGKEAYTRLCNALNKIPGCEWWTSTYNEDGVEGEYSTEQLFPEL